MHRVVNLRYFLGKKLDHVICDLHLSDAVLTQALMVFTNAFVLAILVYEGACTLVRLQGLFHILNLFFGVCWEDFSESARHLEFHIDDNLYVLKLIIFRFINRVHHVPRMLNALPATLIRISLHLLSHLDAAFCQCFVYLIELLRVDICKFSCHLGDERVIRVRVEHVSHRLNQVDTSLNQCHESRVVCLSLGELLVELGNQLAYLDVLSDPSIDHENFLGSLQLGVGKLETVNRGVFITDHWDRWPLDWKLVECSDFFV